MALDDIKASFLLATIWLCYFLGKIHSSDGNTFSRGSIRKSKPFPRNFIMEQLPLLNSLFAAVLIMNNKCIIMNYYSVLAGCNLCR